MQFLDSGISKILMRELNLLSIILAGLDQDYFKKITNLLEGVKSVSFLGSIEKEKLQTILASYDLLLHSSFIEGGSLVIQEAQNAGFQSLQVIFLVTLRC